MEKIYITMLALGILFPLISIAFRLIDGAVEFVEIDFFHLVVGDVDIDFLPLSMNALCMASILFGGISLCLTDMSMLPRHLIAGAAAYLGAVATQTIADYLRAHQAEADIIEGVMLRKCVVCNRIPKDGYGAIVASEKGHSNINLTARSVDGMDLEQGTEVTVQRIEHHVAYVKKTSEETYK